MGTRHELSPSMTSRIEDPGLDETRAGLTTEEAAFIDDATDSIQPIPVVSEILTEEEWLARDGA